MACACSLLTVARSEGEGDSLALFGVMAGILCFYRLSWGPPEERYMKDVTFIAIDAADMDISEEVLFSISLSVLAQAAGCAALHGVGPTALMATCSDMGSPCLQHWICQLPIAHMLGFPIPDEPLIKAKRCLCLCQVKELATCRHEFVQTEHA